MARITKIKSRKNAKTPKLTILVPIYNVEKYLKLCLESIKNQSFKDFECFLINDGSTDNSKEIIENFAKEDSRFVVVNKENTGYGASLNLGLKKANGEYIGIVEPDDFIHRDFYEELLSHDADIVKCSFISFYGETWKTSSERVFHEIKEIRSGDVKIKSRITKKGTLLNPLENQKLFLVDPTIWSAIYKREMLEKNNIKFSETPGANYQDLGFQFKAFSVAKSIYVFEKPLYYYRRDNPNSSVKSDKKVDAVKVECDGIDEFIIEKPELKQIANAVRFRSYNWNLNRLKLKPALSFAKTAKKDFKKSNFDPNFFKKDHEARAGELKFSTKHPISYVFLRPIFHLKNQAIVLAAKLYKKIKR